MAERTSRLLAADARRYRQWFAARFGYRPLTWFLDPGFVCLVIHRLAHACHLRGANLPGRLLMQLNSMLTGIDITPATDLGPGVLLPHPCCVTMSGKTGANTTIGSRVGFGGSVEGEDVGGGPGLPVFGDNVVIGTFGGAQGGHRIGDGAILENGAVLRLAVTPGKLCIVASDPQVAPRGPLDSPETTAPEAVVPEPHDCAHSSVRASYADWRADAQRLLDELARYGGRQRGRLALLIAMTWLPVGALAIQRTAHCLHVRGHRRTARFVAAWNLILFRLSARPEACLGGGALMPHLAGVLIDARIGPHPTLYAGIVVAPWVPGGARPLLGPDAAVNAHCGVLGPVRTGAGINLGPKTQLTEDLPDHARAFSPTTRIKQVDPDTPLRPACHAAPLGPEPLSPWAEYRACLPRDRARLRAVAGSPSIAARLAIRLFRLGRALHRSGMRRAAHWLWRANLYLTGFDGHYGSRIGPGLAMPFPAGVSLACHAGEDLTVMAHAAACAEAGCPPAGAIAQAPRLGAGVWIDHHGGIYGPARVGDGARIMPGCGWRGELPADHVARPGRYRILAGGEGHAAVIPA